MESGYNIEEDALDFLKTEVSIGDPVELVKEVLSSLFELSMKPLFVDRLLLEKTLEKIKPKTETKKKNTSLTSGTKKSDQAYAKEIESNLEIVHDPTKEIKSTGSFEDYLKYFRDRFTKIQSFLRRRLDARDALSVSKVLEMPSKSKVKVIGMITEKREYLQKIFIKIEDLNASINVLASPKVSSNILDKARQLMKDQVICVTGFKANIDMIVAKDLIWPDIPQRESRKASIPVYAALTSDLHVGSKLFMEKEFNRFTKWLEGKIGDRKQREMASHVKYLIIAGDLVDGIGIYPGQINELSTTDIYEQYHTVSRLLEQIPDYIEIVIIPGNHDASRKALPQPTIPKKYAESLYSKNNVHFLGNPSTIKIHGVEVLLYHGRSLDDVAAAVPDVGFGNPDKAMKLLLRSRHLAPIYGERTPISPHKQDFMVIERSPDIFHTGHVHVQRCDTYRGVLMVNSGTWQRQTDYQKMMGLFPTPGIVPIVNLQTLQAQSVSLITSI